MTNGLFDPYHVDESTLICRGIGSNFSFLFHLSKQNSPYGTPRFAVLHLGLFCLSVPHKKDARLILVNQYIDFRAARYLML